MNSDFAVLFWTGYAFLATSLIAITIGTCRFVAAWREQRMRRSQVR